MLDGIDLTRVHPGDVIELPDEEARILILEEWAVPEGDGTARRCGPAASTHPTTRRRRSKGSGNRLPAHK